MGQLQLRENDIPAIRDVWQTQGWPIRTMRMPLDVGEEFANKIRQHKGKFLCEGSFKHGRLSTAFLLVTKTK